MKINKEGLNIILLSVCLAVAIWVAVVLFLQTWLFIAISIVILAFLVCIISFFREPKRPYVTDESLVYAPADGKIVVIEEVEENEYFKDRRLMVSIFMNVVNVHANWIPVDGTVKLVRHHNGNFHKAWLPKASIENERSTVVIETPEGTEILARQIAGAVARRIVTYAKEGEECYIDEHMGFIKFGSRVDVYLPLDTEVCVKMGQKTTGNETILARLK